MKFTRFLKRAIAITLIASSLFIQVQPAAFVTQSTMEKRLLIASWLFLIGSGLFMIDAISEIATRFSPMSLLHLLEGVLFLFGSIFFMPDARTEP